uniref:HMA domain-containing protein n=1 Tax=Picea sitchensis TaxID=3332 RepID=D5A8X5_PICSI|nr:unknown [Picea sitchensis]
MHQLPILRMPNLQLVPASQIQKVELRVPLYSYGCERKIRKALSQFKGLDSIDVEFYQQKVTVTGSVNRDEVLAAMKAKRKNTRFWSAEDGKSELDMTGGSKGEIMEYSKKPAAASTKTLKEHLQGISNVVFQQYQTTPFQQYQTTPYKRAIWYADSEGDMRINITAKEETSSVMTFSGDRKSIKTRVCNIIRKAVYAVIGYCSKPDSFEKLSGL